jgi:hypothetical protein
MPTTTIQDSTFSVSAVGSRTDSAGSGVTDYTAEEVRFAQQILTEGYLQPTSAFQVTAQSTPNMTVKVGSGTSRSDYYVVAGDSTGQGNYIARLDVTSQNITISASDASQTRTDEIYLIVADNAYDSSARVLPRFGYRKGDLGGASPGADSTWKASVLLARITVAANVTTITNANISDQRVKTTLNVGLSTSQLWTPRMFLLGSDVLASSTTPVAAFSVPITDTGRYLVEGFLHYAAAPSTNMRMTWTTPTSSTGRWSSGGILASVGSRIGSLDTGMVDIAVALAVSGDSGGPTTEISARPVMHLNCINTGTLALAIGQDTSTAFNTTLRAGSSLRVTRIS